MRQRPKSRINPRFLPQRKQRRTTRLLNFGFLSDRTYVDVFAILGTKNVSWFGGYRSPYLELPVFQGGDSNSANHFVCFSNA